MAAEAIAVGAAAFAWAGVLVQAWALPWNLPLDSRGDATQHAAMLKTIGEQGWWLHQPRLGAPFGQELYDFPHGGETVQLFVLKLLMKVTGGWGSALNVYFLAGFGVLAVVAFLVLRHLRFGPVVAAVGSLIYTFLPYHLWHGESHLLRSTDVSAPLAALLLVWLGSWRERFLIDADRRGPRAWRRNLRASRVAGAVAIAAVIGGTETMTTAFTMTFGFQGLWFDTFGYAHPRAEAAAVQATVGMEPLRSHDGRFLFFDLRPYARLLNLTPAQARAAAIQGVGIAPPRGASS